MSHGLGLAVAPPETSLLHHFQKSRAESFWAAPPTPSNFQLAKTQWLKAREAAQGHPIELGSHVVLQVESPDRLGELLAGSPALSVRRVNPNLYLVRMPDARQALQEAARMQAQPGVLSACPEKRRRLIKAGPYAPRPNDPLFARQWHLENRHPTGFSAGPDFNARPAWAQSRGAGVVIAVVDDGVELTHPEFTNRAAGQPHFNFDLNTAVGGPAGPSAAHSTAVAGWAVAEGNNGIGISGLAPEARLASLVIFRADDSSVGESSLMDMFQYRLDTIAIQNHSWTSSQGTLTGPSLLEQAGLGNALTNGRSGRGVIMVRAGGNGREYEDNVNDDGYISDPRVIAVAAVRADGKVASYSTPGACLLVAGLAGDTGFDASLTTDRQGALGYNGATNSAGDYTDGFTGTSAVAPQIAGLAALLLSANSNLTVRDVQQILVLSARHYDLADPHLQTNRAGFRVSQNVGFGVPDAGLAVKLAARWSNRPPLTELRYTNASVSGIPDAGARVVVSGTGVPSSLASIAALPSDLGQRPDQPTASLPLVDAGLVTGPLSNSLAGAGALIQRGEVYFSDKILWAAQAGAAFAVIYNNLDEPNLVRMSVTDDLPIPAMFISKLDGEALRQLILTNATVTARLQLNPVVRTFSVPATLLCEHVGVRIKTDHPQRGDLRITLRSPGGTLSVLQRTGPDTTPDPEDWTYYSAHHFFESSYGQWTLQVNDEMADYSGGLRYAELIVRGVAFNDANHDGLDDQWEQDRLHTATADATADPDGDGFANVREMILGTDPLTPNEPARLSLSWFDPGILRLSWPASAAYQYQLFGGGSLSQPLLLLTNLPGQFPETEWFTPAGNAASFFRFERAP